jgi:hypothetical protein
MNAEATIKAFQEFVRENFDRELGNISRSLSMNGNLAIPTAETKEKFHFSLEILGYAVWAVTRLNIEEEDTRDNVD